MYCKNNQSQTDNKIKKKGYLIKKLSLIWGGRKNKNKELKKKQRLAICSHHEAISQCRRDNSSENSRLQIAQPFWHSSCFSNIRFNLTLTCRPILLVQSNKSTYYFQCESIATVTTYQYSISGYYLITVLFYLKRVANIFDYWDSYFVRFMIK